jgi:chromosome segregation ATPase
MADKAGKSGLFGTIGGALKGLVLEEVPETSAAPAPSASVPTTPAPSRPRSVSAAVPDAKIRQVIESAVHEAALPAYVAFKALADSMSAAIPDERTRIAAAIAALKTQGHDLAAVLKDIDECFAALDQKEREAQAAADKQMKDRVGGLELTCKGMDDRAAELEAELAELKKKMLAARESIQHETAEIQATHDTFVAAVQSMRNELLQMKSKLTTNGQ